MRRNKRPKEEIAEDYCFVCKDGGKLLICEYGDCLKAYHPQCVDKDESFLESGECWTCDWHRCVICQKSSHFQCFSCPTSVCGACIGATKFVQLRKTKGFCNVCLKLSILAEENADVDSDGCKLDFDNIETKECLFKEYWDIIKEQEKLSMDDLHEAEALLKKGENYRSSNKSGQILEYERELTSDAEDMNKSFDDYMSFPEDKVSRNRKKHGIKRSRSMKRNFIGWGSVELIEFLTFLGKNTTEPLNQWDVCEIIENYIREKNLLHPNRKRKTVLCDDKLHSLFRKKTVRIVKIYNLLEGHFAANVDSDDSDFGLENDSEPVAPKKLRRSSSECERRNKREKVCESPKSHYASMIDKNIKLVYLRRSLLKEFLKDPETFERKVVGCFVRVKSDPRDFDFSPNKLYMLRQVSGIKNIPEAYMVGEMSTTIVLLVSNIWKDIRISILSDDDIEEEECEDLRQLVKKGLFRQLTVVELEAKVGSIHEDIMSHWIKREIAVLQRQIDRANEKGWHREKCEYIQRRALLQTESEKVRLLKEIPKVLPDIQDLKDMPTPQKNSLTLRENEGKKSELSEKAIDAGAEGLVLEKAVEAKTERLVLEKAVEAKDEGVGKPKSTAMKQSLEDIEIIEIDDDDDDDDDDDEPPETMAKSSLVSCVPQKKPIAFGEGERVWYYLDPAGRTQGPFAMSSLRHWESVGHFNDTFRVWSIGQSQRDSILLKEALLLTHIGNKIGNSDSFLEKSVL